MIACDSSAICQPTSSPSSYYITSSFTFPLFSSHSDLLPSLLRHCRRRRRRRRRRQRQMMARMLVMFALCVLPALVSARYVGNPFTVKGRVYCDTCRAGFETNATPGIPGARVRIECKDRDTLQLKYSIEGVTDSTGAYNIVATGDRGDDICDAVLVSSPQSDCAEADPGRDRARVVLTGYNGLISDTRFANAMGFLRTEPMSGCTELLQKYKDADDA